jgi:histidinol dehydrogenase
MASAWARHSVMVEQPPGGVDPAIVVACVVCGVGLILLDGGAILEMPGVKS